MLGDWRGVFAGEMSWGDIHVILGLSWRESRLLGTVGSVVTSKFYYLNAIATTVTYCWAKAVVSADVGYGENAVKSSTCWIWRPARNVIDHTSKDSGSYMFKRFDCVDLIRQTHVSPQSSKDAVADDAGKKTNEEPTNEGERNGQEKEGEASNKEDDQNVPSVSTARQIFTNADDPPTDHLMPDLKDTADLLNTSIFSGAYDDEDNSQDHPKDQIIGDINSATQTRRMTKISEELAMIQAAIEACKMRCFSFDSRKMDVKSAFLYGTIEEEVYVCQTPGCEDPQFPNKVYKVEKALYSLHQAPRAWYETLSTYLLENGFRRGIIDKTLFIKKNQEVLHDAQEVPDDFYGELTFFLGLQVMQRDDGIFISQDEYVADILKKFDFVTIKTSSAPFVTNKALSWMRC
ncbi:putative ribonuclease H-like domain-containing protein [Tanacetum coccineum]|uniref:Ribonuclease H-like domain-containing protein n=1 Tax=Tanacetum coccineum TaxID=301880 RepID=A0ABQ5E8B6_9ASTR